MPARVPRWLTYTLLGTSSREVDTGWKRIHRKQDDLARLLKKK